MKEENIKAHLQTLKGQREIALACGSPNADTSYGKCQTCMYDEIQPHLESGCYSANSAHKDAGLSSEPLFLTAMFG